MKFVSLSLKVVFLSIRRQEVSLEVKEDKEKIYLTKD